MNVPPDRPIPVRDVVPPPEPPPPPPPPAPETTPPEPPPSRSLHVEGRVWKVELLGRSRTGSRGDAGALLLHLRFSPDEAQADAGTPGEEAREGWSVGRSLEAVSDDGLLEAYRQSRAWTRS